MRTYSGHSSARASNELYRTNLAKGQTGLSIAFDLPTQTGYDPDHVLAHGEVGKVGVPVVHLGHMRTLLEQHPARADEHVDDHQRHRCVAVGPLRRQRRGAGRRVRRAARHHPERHRQGVPVAWHVHLPARAHRKRLIVDMVAWCAQHAPEVEPDERLQLPPAGGRGDAGAGDRLLAGHRHRRARRGSRLGPGRRRNSSRQVFGSISFFVNAGIRFVEEICKLRAFTELWDRIGLERYGVTDEKARRFRYGVQVNSLGLTEAQPENNVQRIVLEMLAVTLSKRARARSVQLPAWNEALGLPRPWDQQWSLRMQQVLAFETDLLEYGDLFDGSTVIEAKTDRAARRSVGRTAGRAVARWRVRGGRRAEGTPGAVDGRAHSAHRGRRADGRRRQRVHRERSRRRWTRRATSSPSTRRSSTN